ncbi:MAG: hypothetical protein IJD73_04875 [Clostridia bacterium]|nr:hypothetical protein [Clostridia bacterium]
MNKFISGKKILAFLLALVFAVTALASCAAGGPNDSTQQSGSESSSSSSSLLYNDIAPIKPDASLNAELSKPQVNKPASNKAESIVTKLEDGGIEVMAKANASLAPLTLTTGTTTSYTIKSFYNVSLTGITNFVNTLKTKTGVTFTPTLITNTSGISGKQIVIGSFASLASMSGAPTFKSWTGGAAWASGNTIYICVAEAGLLDSTLKSFANKIQKSGNNYVVAADLKLAYDKCAVSEYIPSFSTSGTDKGLYSAGGGNYQKTYKGVTAAEVTAYCTKLLKSGFSLHQKNMINSNAFYLYVSGDTIVHINHFAKLDQFSIVYGPKTYLPAKSPITGYTKKATPTITQLALGETGTSMVLQLEDGSFVLIDGGLGGSTDTYTKDSTNLMNFLTSNAPNGEKPRLTWIVTHIHTDHRQLMQKLLPNIKDKIVLELVAWNMPDFSTLSAYTPNWKESNPAKNYVESMNLVNTALKNSFPNAPIYTFHTGEKLYLPGCEVEFLATQEDYYLNNFEWINDTSAAFRITMQGKTVMVFGDCTANVNSKIMTAAFGSYIKSDIMQITHHGVGGGTLATFKAVDPDICLWSLNEDKFTSDERATGSTSKNPENVWLRADSGSDGQRARQHYHHSDTTTITIPSMSVKVTTVYTDR